MNQSKSRFCCVPNCIPGTSRIYYFPIHNLQLFNQWVTNVGNPKLKTFLASQIYRNYGVCERHFTSDCIHPEKFGGRLKISAVPTLFLPAAENEKQEETDETIKKEPYDVEVAKEKGKSRKKDTVNISATFSHICKLCLSQGNLQNLKDSEFTLTNVVINLLEIVLDHKIPENICETCIKEIKQIEVFIQKCKHSQSILNQITQQIRQCDKVQSDIKIELVESEEELGSNVEIQPTVSDNEKKEVVVEIKDLVDNDFILHEELHLPVMKVEEVASTFDDLNQNGIYVKPIQVAERICKRCGETVITLKDHFKTHKDCLPKNVKSQKIKVLESKITDLTSKDNLVSSENQPVQNLENVAKSSVLNLVNRVCKNCGETVTTMVEHYKTHKDCRPKTQCPVCGKLMSNKVIKNHLMIHTSKLKLNFMCHICSKMFKYKVSLKRHLLVHEMPKRFICEMCGNGYSTKIQLDEHINKHNGLKPFSCTYCAKKFTHRSSRKQHEDAHIKGRLYPENNAPHPQPEGPVTCNICLQEFVHERALKLHRVVHDENRTFPCSLCKKTFESRKLLNIHSEVHYNEKPFSCDQCKKRFKNKGCLVSHMRSHTGEQPFACTECPKKFGQLSHLSYHMKLHMGQKAFVCQYCQKSFTLKGNLTVHLRLHTGEKPYVCHVCKMGFRDSSMRKRHIISKHGKEQVQYIEITDVGQTLPQE